ncbi:MAG: hypothetical protein K2K51_00445 [Bacteroidales bacterium]|nr:hypothetical protein [Bacteroidales bacterium]
MENVDKNRQNEELDMIKNRTFDNEKGGEILDGVYVLAERAQYDEVTGISLDCHWLDEILKV